MVEVTHTDETVGADPDGTLWAGNVERIIMQEVIGDIWDYWLDMYLIAIPVNGFVKKNGRAVMGMGLAKQARERILGIDLVLGEAIKREGWANIYWLAPGIVSFPVKRDHAIYDGTSVVRHMRGRLTIGDPAPGWALKAETAIIESSLRKLQRLNRHVHVSTPYLIHYSNVVIPRVGCGAGELDWVVDVKPLCERCGDWLLVTSL